MHLYTLAFFSLFSMQALGSLPFFDQWASFDPKNITLEDPGFEILAELPQGNLDLKKYVADSKEIRRFGNLYKIDSPENKDFSKAPNCTRAEIAALKLWQSNDVYRNVNAILRGAQAGKVNGVAVEDKDETLILMIASGVNCAPQYKGPVVRGENAPDFIFNQYKEGSYIGLRGFTATSKGDKLTTYFEELSKQRIKIQNAQGADLDALGIASWPDEHEVLIRPGTVFKVKSKIKSQGSKYIEWDFSFDQN